MKTRRRYIRLTLVVPADVGVDLDEDRTQFLTTEATCFGNYVRAAADVVDDGDKDGTCSICCVVEKAQLVPVEDHDEMWDRVYT
jgi:hypothetical protein